MNSVNHSEPQKLTLKRTSTLFECENVLKTINIPGLQNFLSLSSDDRKVFLKDLRTVAIVSAASRTPRVTCEWIDNVSPQTHESLVGLAGSVYGIPPAKEQQFVSIFDVKQSLAQRLDILEDPPGIAETLTICAVDEESRAQPLALPGLLDREAFITKFQKFVEEYFDKGKSQGFLSSIGPSLFDDSNPIADDIFGFIYELYQNTFNHGALDEDQQTIPGLRLIRLRKRIAHGSSRNDFIRGASGFTELEEYFEENAPLNRTFKFYEISISDNGLGILHRFRTTTRAKVKQPASLQGNLELLNRIISKSLSSDSMKSNVGEGGLKKALRAVDSAKGFVSLRCDNLWVCRRPTGLNLVSEYEWLSQVKGSENLSTIPGTHFSMFLLAA